MARGINKVILVGNCGQDPEVRYMPNGNAVANVTLATSESYKDKNTGQTVEKTEWHRVVFFGKTAEIVGEYCRKGSQIYIEGKLQTRKWTDQQGVERYATEVVVDMSGQMQMLGQRQGGQQNGQGGNNYQGQGGQQQGNNSYGNGNNNYQNNAQGQQSAPRQGQNNQQQGGYNNQQQGGYNSQQQGSYNNQQQGSYNNQQQGGPQNPMEPPIDFDDSDIPFAPIGLQYPALLMCM